MKNEYAKLPWSMEVTIENLKKIKEHLKRTVKRTNLHGKGEEDAKEIDFDFDRAIKALEKQVPKKPINAIKDDNEFICVICPCCQQVAVEFNDVYCRKCGQKLDWSEEE